MTHSQNGGGESQTNFGTAVDDWIHVVVGQNLVILVWRMVTDEDLGRQDSVWQKTICKCIQNKG